MLLVFAALHQRVTTTETTIIVRVTKPRWRHNHRRNSHESLQAHPAADHRDHPRDQWRSDRLDVATDRPVRNPYRSHRHFGREPRQLDLWRRRHHDVGP